MPRLVSLLLGLALVFIPQALAGPDTITDRENLPYREATGPDAYSAQRCKLDVYLPAAPAERGIAVVAVLDFIAR